MRRTSVNSSQHLCDFGMNSMIFLWVDMAIMKFARLVRELPWLASMLCMSFMLSLPVAAPAKGTVRIQQVDNLVQTYSDVNIFLLGKKLMLTSSDNVSTIVIGGSRCVPMEELFHCTGGGLSVIRNGLTYTLPFKSASFYFNLTDRPQPLSLSSTKVGARSVLFVAQTSKGTYITGNGRLDVLDMDQEIAP